MSPTTKAPGTDIATFDPAQSNYPVLFGDAAGSDVAEMLQENLGDEGFQVSDLPRVKVPTGAGLFWDTGEDSTPQRTLTGVVVLWTTFRSYYEKAFGAPDAEKDAPPDCASTDGKIGFGEYGKGSTKHPAGDCASCPMNQWDSARQGSGKACSERRGLWMLFKGDILPTQVVLPPTSLKPFRQHMLNLIRSQKPFYAVETTLSLEKVSGAVDYARVVVKRGDDLDPAEAAAAKQYGAGIRHSLDEAARAQAASRGATPAQNAAAADPWASEDNGPDIPEHLQD